MLVGTAFVVRSAALLAPDEPRLVATAAFEGYELEGEVVPVQGFLGAAADRARQHAVAAAALAGVTVGEWHLGRRQRVSLCMYVGCDMSSEGIVEHIAYNDKPRPSYQIK